MNLALMEDVAIDLRGTWKFDFYKGDIERDVDGKITNRLVEHAEYENLITNVGKALILNRVYALGGIAALSNTGVGTSNTAAAVGNTTLTGGVWKGYDATPTIDTTTPTAPVVTSITTYTTAEANIAIAEAALSNGAPATSAGTILNRLAPIGPFTKSTAVSLSITVLITQA